MSNKVKLKFKIENRFGLWVESVEKKFELLVEKAAYDIKSLAQAKIPVDTGAAKNSMHVVTEHYTEQAQAEANAKAVKPHVEFASDAGIEAKHLTALVVVAVVYGMALEYGTEQNSNMLSSRNGQRPYLTPSVYEYEDTFFAACREILRAA